MRRIPLVFCAFLWISAANAQRAVTVAVVQDGPQYAFSEIADYFRDELVALTAGEFAIEFKEFNGTWSQESIRQSFNDAYQDPEVDIVLGLGITGNQMAVANAEFPKPTFLPLVFDTQLMGAPTTGTSSGKRNLNFLAERVSLEDELLTYQRITPFENATVLVDQLILDAIPQLNIFGQQIAQEVGITLTFLGHDGSNHDLASRIPDDDRAVLYGALPRLPPDEFDALIETFIIRKIPTFTLSDRSLVERGMLAADTVDTDWLRLARRNALNIQAVLIGERAQDQPVFFKGKQELTINMETARRIGLSPRFDVLTEATLINDVPMQTGLELDLAGVANAALQANLDFRAETLNLAASEQDVTAARAGLFPQVGIGGQQLRRRVTPTVQQGALAERSTDVSLSFSQNIYSDDVYANLDIQRSVLTGIEAGFDSARLDLIRDATLAYINVLQVENELSIQKDNLELTKSNLDLARDRVRIGTSTNTDVFRWQSNLALARGDLIRAREQVSQAREQLNQILHLPLTNVTKLKPADNNDAFVISKERFGEIVDNPRAYGWITEKVIETGIILAPELAQIDAQIKAKEREIRNRTRDFWLPDLTLDSQFLDNLSQSGVGAGGIGDGLHDWSVAINANLPIFSGGRRRAELARSRLELRRLEVERASLTEKIAQQISAAMHNLYASYANIELSEEAAIAANKTLELVTDAYATGTLGILDLLDAQNQSLSAELGAKNAIYVFLADAIRMQRASGRFEFLLSADEAAIVNKQIEDYLLGRQAEISPSELREAQ